MNKYSINIENGITHVRFNETLRYNDIKPLVQSLAGKNIYRKRIYNVIDVGFELSKEEIIKLSNLGKNIFKEKNRGCIVTNQILPFGEGRQFSTYREDEYCEFDVFKKIDEAIIWLNRPF